MHAFCCIVLCCIVLYTFHFLDSRAWRTFFSLPIFSRKVHLYRFDVIRVKLHVPVARLARSAAGNGKSGQGGLLGGNVV